MEQTSCPGQRMLTALEGKVLIPAQQRSIGDAHQ